MRTADLTPDLLLSAYAQGIFPMAETRDSDVLHWFDPQRRGILPLDNFHISHSLRRFVLRENFTIRTNSAFSAVVAGCAARPETWISAGLVDLYDKLHDRGLAHSVEVWDAQGLAGGVFGIALGGAFFGESMFSQRTNASKIALVWLVDRLRRAGFSLLDTQYITPHLQTLGGREIPRAAYRALLARALARRCQFTAPPEEGAQSVLQRMTQTS
ncbi:leucyl/phenylalanyl-tRNA--protein transferase [Rhodobacter veldkampii DSM 11550]|uniref:Leucyl/phenylalanyl-tRNA--protein transferase n=1 Tax=Phaeovulum veldkampii DSM 11550 TaxID=1185920 RepID=A0A2T4JHU2_9RHOB|nr:leucyl/phenylalanyl-tRNA--protein transferase [Phaeovulum veldkampii]MBK5946175.1 leucyl/phenylalanyl-tRNA--protein transferase [Phaeovulum veldkampii DSM 11550]PTE17347.1 leucyl/phenylalanyl-tRNA--protein transferase [Phaeovulum veldkampii DSM 11550]TDQ56566.1 leucyl/phenylalanyl-tRNA--protein transferase [Phaeovulum veldkampii DSM 11550]